jgi:ABC-type multidrug transport system fused ATPase/permease subunit
MNSFERLLHYWHDLKKEPPRILKSDPSPDEWPSKGKISFKNLTIAYPTRPNYLVLKNVNLEMKAGEKIGLVGRTGSGKSTLVTSLIRFINQYEGDIDIDGVEIKTIGLELLRKSIFMVPQVPVIFKGSIRSNVDTMGQYSDSQIWQALKCCGLEKFASDLPQQLDAPIDTDGTNLSSGQKQALCVVAAVLAEPKVITCLMIDYSA